MGFPPGTGLRAVVLATQRGATPKGALFPTNTTQGRTRRPPKPLLPYKDDSGCDGDPGHEPVGDGVRTVGVADGVIATVEPSLVRGIHERQDGERQSGWRGRGA